MRFNNRYGIKTFNYPSDIKGTTQTVIVVNLYVTKDSWVRSGSSIIGVSPVLSAPSNISAVGSANLDIDFAITTDPIISRFVNANLIVDHEIFIQYVRVRYFQAVLLVHPELEASGFLFSWSPIPFDCSDDWVDDGSTCSDQWTEVVVSKMDWRIKNG